MMTTIWEKLILKNAAGGEVPDSIINDKARRMLRLIVRTAMSGNHGFGSMNTPEHVAAARKIAQEAHSAVEEQRPPTPCS